ncbi:unnamed protein product [Toxocara canis]|uniref:Transmembrane protein n=1 Tax=Toxocara canis TaxID=6265 RepID=A0A183UH91_TOXCA|nr:unnamed protein product [Toxocara canis]
MFAQFIDGKVICLGLIQSLFEGSMYVFVLEWTPALTHASNGEPIPHGYIFASFMVAIMMGSSMFKMLTRVVLLVSSVCLAAPILFADYVSVIYAAFLVFELCVGMFWPAMGFMRGIYVPEQTRSTIMNFCRVPLNAIVITILLQNLSMRLIFHFCVLFLALATVSQHYLYRRHIASPHEGTDCGNVVSDADRQSPGNRIAPNDANSGTVSSVTLEMSARPVEGVLRKREGSLPDLRGDSATGANHTRADESTSDTTTETPRSSKSATD